MATVISIESYYYMKLITIMFDKSVVLSNITQVHN